MPVPDTPASTVVACSRPAETCADTEASKDAAADETAGAADEAAEAAAEACDASADGGSPENEAVFGEKLDEAAEGVLLFDEELHEASASEPATAAQASSRAGQVLAGRGVWG
ncbi:hypothetical protein [Kitasatospora nipponensis]|uniref:hypothetical protein n=1 Tax=Kitasatospora nipponensis TaxID=258049 RepID=UPI0031DCECA0